jgi:hypothetical protein
MMTAIFVLSIILMPATVLGVIALARSGTDDYGDRSLFMPLDHNGNPRKF